jgi:hypothetical protein
MKKTGINSIGDVPKSFLLRHLCEPDVTEYPDMLYDSFNARYWKHGWGKDY